MRLVFITNPKIAIYEGREKLLPSKNMEGYIAYMYAFKLKSVEPDKLLYFGFKASLEKAQKAAEYKITLRLIVDEKEVSEKTAEVRVQW